jgi:hypothetical protein
LICNWVLRTGWVVVTWVCSSAALAGNSGDESPLFPGRVIRRQGEQTVVGRGRSPRLDGLSYQYQNLGTPLRGNLILSDVLLPGDAWHLWNGRPVERFDLTKQTPENYHDSHNHYQSLLSEVINATSGANGIPFWGDSNAVVNGANAWGAFVSARSSCAGNELVASYLPKGLARGCGPDFDAQLTGIEVDVLNGGKPGIYPNKAKHGVQIVGFGNPNGQAISVISEYFDREQKFRRGQFESILYAQSSIQPDYGRFIVMDFEKAKIGLDMRKPLFSEGAIDFRSEGLGTGILLSSGRSGEIYGGLRWPGFKDNQEWLSTRLGVGGYRIVSNDNRKELVAIDNHGGIYLSGDIYLNGTKVSAMLPLGENIVISKRWFAAAVVTILVLLMAANMLLLRFLATRSTNSSH